MSILLEALRKSENRKRRGHIPTIHEQDAAEVARRKIPAGPLALVLVPAFLVMAWLVYSQYADSPEQGWDLVEKPSAVTAAPADGQESTAAPAEQAADTAQQAAPTVEPPQPRPQAAQQKPTPRTPVEKLAASSDSNVATASPDKTSNTDKTPAPVKKVANNKDKPAASVAPVARQTASASEAPDTRIPEPISFWELPASVRGDLPEFRISVLVWAEQASDRFILINGMRLQQGGHLVPNLVLQEVRRDGAVFSYRHYQFIVRQ